MDGLLLMISMLDMPTQIELLENLKQLWPSVALFNREALYAAKFQRSEREAETKKIVHMPLKSTRHFGTKRGMGILKK